MVRVVRCSDVGEEEVLLLLGDLLLELRGEVVVVVVIGEGGPSRTIRGTPMVKRWSSLLISFSIQTVPVVVELI